MLRCLKKHSGFINRARRYAYSSPDCALQGRSARIWGFGCLGCTAPAYAPSIQASITTSLTGPPPALACIQKVELSWPLYEIEKWRVAEREKWKQTRPKLTKTNKKGRIVGLKKRSKKAMRWCSLQNRSASGRRQSTRWNT